MELGKPLIAHLALQSYSQSINLKPYSVFFIVVIASGILCGLLFQIGEPLHIVAIRHNRFAIHELGYAILFCHIVYSSVLFVAFSSTGAKVQ